MGEKRVYDLAFGVGATCRCSMSLREGGLQFYSFPFDWTAGPTVMQKVELMCRDFDGWMRRESFVRLEGGAYGHNVCWRDDVLGYYFVHEFNDKSPFDEQFPEVSERLKKRARRLLEMIGRSKRVLVMFLQTPENKPETVDSLKAVRCKLHEKWPGVEFDILLVQHDEGRKRNAFLDYESEGVRNVKFDYKDRRESVGWVADQKQVGKWLAAHYEVTDYRTPEERAGWKARQREQKFARFKATGWGDYLITKFRYKLYVHLRKRMERKGLI